MSAIAPAREAPEQSAATTDVVDRTSAAASLAPAVESSAPNRGARAFFVGLFVVLAALLIASASAGIWLRDTVLDTDNFVEAVAPLPEEPRVADAVAGFVAEEVISVTDAQDAIEDALRPVVGDDAALVAGPVTSAVETLVRDATDEIVRSAEFRTVWEDVTRIAHEELVLVLRGDGDAVTSADGRVQLNLLPIVNGVLAGLSSDASELFGSDVEIPQLSADDLKAPEAARQQLESVLGIDLPEDFGTITVYEDGDLGEVQTTVRWIDDLLVVSALAAVLAAAAAIGISLNRRRTIAGIGLGVVAASVALWIVADIVERDILSGIGDLTAREAANAATDLALLRGLEGHLGLVGFIAGGIALIAWLVGPGRTATLVRTAFAPGSELARFAACHEPTIQAGAGVVAVVVLIAWEPMTWGRFFAIVVIVGIVMAVVRSLAARSVEATPAPSPAQLDTSPEGANP